uniref:Regeneration-upregulated protein 2 n=1 Tax=Enchytraeus japonensis TaxID=228735 RepID=Q1MX39_9ANNE|nr:regeneration-upregulated protein 2 [Enchytraeus japonensis]
MTENKNVQECFDWISTQHEVIERSGSGSSSRPEVELSHSEHRNKSHDVINYASTVDRVKSEIQDEKRRSDLENAYFNLKDSTERKLNCLENNTKIVSLESLFSPLSATIYEMSERLVQLTPRDSSHNKNTNTGYTAQRCILATRAAWQYVSKQLKCSEIQLQHATEYHQFYHDMSQYTQWMPADLLTVEALIRKVNQRPSSQIPDPDQLIPDMNTALSLYLGWRSRVDESYERSKKITPIHLRLKRLSHERPALALCDYNIDGLDIKEGEELYIVDNSKPDKWRVRNLRSDSGVVPSVQIVIRGPDAAAIDAAMRLRLEFYDKWMSAVRRLGKALINYISATLLDWSADQESKLMSLSPAEKKKLLSMLHWITDVFSPYWDPYTPYKTLLAKVDRLKTLLGSNAPRGYRGEGVSPPDVVPWAEGEEEMLRIYKMFWDAWEQFRCLSDARHRPETLLGQADWDKYKLFDSIDCLRKWQSELNQADEDLMDGLLVEDELYTLETAKETAETCNISTCEQEESQTFIITAVEDPRTGVEISLDEACSVGIINQMEGKYTNPDTRESIPIPHAMNLGKIRVEFTKTKKSAEKKSDLGLITIRTCGEPRPFTIRAVVDPLTDRHLTVDEAIKQGVLDQKRGVYRNSVTNQELSMADALDSRLLVVEFEHGDDVDHGEREVLTKTYAIHHVIDTRTGKRLTFAEAVRLGFVDADTGAYKNKKTGQTVYVGDAIKQGWIIASVVTDPSALDIAPGHAINLTNQINGTNKPMNGHHTGLTNGHAAERVNGSTLTNGSNGYH